MKTMNNHNYIKPETDICVLHMNGQVLQGYTIIDLSKPQETTGGEINTNDSGIWDEADSEIPDESSVWDSF